MAYHHVPRLALPTRGEAAIGQPAHDSTASTFQATDFQAHDLTLPGALMGTAPYMSPEQTRGENLDARSDIFSFGAVLYEMVTGQPAFSGETTRQIRETILTREPTPPRKLNPRMPAVLERVIIKALKKRPEERYQRAAGLRADLIRVRGKSGTRWRSFWAGCACLTVGGHLSNWEQIEEQIGNRTWNSRVKRPQTNAT
jgi:eukaryotic-like serine/threonine-protein kinase